MNIANILTCIWRSNIIRITSYIANQLVEDKLYRSNGLTIDYYNS